MNERRRVEKQITEIDETRGTTSVNTYRIHFEDGAFHIDFGIWQGEDEVRVVGRNILADEQIFNFILDLFASALEYADAFNKEIIPKELQRVIDEQVRQEE